MRLDVTDFGAIGDGVTDNSDALIAVRDLLHQSRQIPHILDFSPGTYNYSNNRWLWGVGRVTVSAYGAKFQNTAAAGWHANMRPLNTHSIFDADGDVPETAPKSFNSGVRFDPALPGATSLTALEVHDFAVGDRVLLLGYNQQSGNSFPPNARFFQWNRLTDVQANVLTLATPLLYEFRAAGWKDTELIVDGGSLFIGQSRILKLDRDDFFYPYHIEIEGAEFLPHATPSPDSLVVAADTFIARDVKTAGRLVPSENRIASYENCVAPGAEPDKICDQVTFSNCDLTGSAVSEATGINSLTIQDCDLSSSIEIAPRALYMRRNRIVQDAGDEFGAVKSKEVWPTDRLVFEDNTITHDGSLRHAINDGIAQSFMPTAQGQAMIVVDDLAQKIAIGSFLFAEDLSDSGRVTDIEHDGTNLLLHGTWAAPPTGNWAFYAIQDIAESGTIYVGGDVEPRRNSRLPQGTGQIVVSNFRFDLEANRRQLLGSVTKIRGTIIRPYTGPDISSGLRVRLDGVKYLDLNWLQAGTAEATVPSVATDELAIWFNKLGGGPITGAPEQMPKFIVEVDADPLGWA